MSLHAQNQKKFPPKVGWKKNVWKCLGGGLGRFGDEKWLISHLIFFKFSVTQYILEAWLELFFPPFLRRYLFISKFFEAPSPISNGSPQVHNMNSMKRVIPLHFISWERTPNDAATPQCQSQFTPKMKANAESRLLSFWWIDCGIVVSQHPLESFLMK